MLLWDIPQIVDFLPFLYDEAPLGAAFMPGSIPNSGTEPTYVDPTTGKSTRITNEFKTEMLKWLVYHLMCLCTKKDRMDLPTWIVIIAIKVFRMEKAESSCDHLIMDIGVERMLHHMFDGDRRKISGVENEDENPIELWSPGVTLGVAEGEPAGTAKPTSTAWPSEPPGDMIWVLESLRCHRKFHQVFIKEILSHKKCDLVTFWNFFELDGNEDLSDIYSHVERGLMDAKTGMKICMTIEKIRSYMHTKKVFIMESVHFVKDCLEDEGGDRDVSASAFAMKPQPLTGRIKIYVGTVKDGKLHQEGCTGLIKEFPMVKYVIDLSKDGPIFAEF